MSDLRPVLTLDELARDPKRAAELPQEARARIVLTCSAILAAVASAPAESRGAVTPANGSSPLLTMAQAADRANVPLSWIRQVTRDGRLPSIKFGHYRRVKPSDLEHFIEKGRLTAGGD